MMKISRLCNICLLVETCNYLQLRNSCRYETVYKFAKTYRQTMDPTDENTSLTENGTVDSSRCLKSRYLGSVLGMTACTVAAGSDTLKKLIMVSMGPVELTCVRNVFILIVYICIFKYNRITVNISRKKHAMVIIGSICKGSVLYMRCAALQHISLVESTTFMFTNLIYTGPASFLCLGLPMGIYDVLAILTCLAGTILVCHPAFIFNTGEDVPVMAGRPLGIYLAISATALSTVNTYIIRYVQEAPVSYLMILQTSFGVIIGAVVLLAGKEQLVIPTEGITYVFLIATLAGIFIYSTLETFSNKMVEAHEYAVIQTTELIASFVLQVCIFFKFPSELEYVGSALIVLAVVAYALKEPFNRFIEFLGCIRN